MSQELFHRSHQYTAMLQQGLDLSGEDQRYFIQGRLLDLQRRLSPNWAPRRIADFGCGIGLTSHELAGLFPSAEVVGLDASDPAIAHARHHYASARISFESVRKLNACPPFDLCYVNGVFHHIEPSERLSVAKDIFRALNPGGYLSLFENNPWNPGARFVMKRIPFDRDAHMLSSRTARCLLQQAGFQNGSAARYLFYFPRKLSGLRFLEPWLSGIPLGAQYHILVRKGSAAPGSDKERQPCG